ncbi:hypothetical protein [Geminocystis herdmanii]|uniref:hypothetical protein n=1 Tax=Geminocystis herdmanii TaxID=669359 RepID=UPI00130DBB24|nr:hypothetical protein [Geminocystis herdmanii]
MSSNRWLETPVETENPSSDIWKPTSVSVGSAREDVTIIYLVGWALPTDNHYKLTLIY